MRPATDSFSMGAFGAKRTASRTTSRRATSGSSSRGARNSTDLPRRAGPAVAHVSPSAPRARPGGQGALPGLPRRASHLFAWLLGGSFEPEGASRGRPFRAGWRKCVRLVSTVVTLGIGLGNDSKKYFREEASLLQGMYLHGKTGMSDAPVSLDRSN